MNKNDALQEGFYLEKWLVEPPLGRLSREGAETVQIEPKIMEVLVLLAENDLKVVRRETFLEKIWGDAHVIDHVLARAISELRRAFRDNPQNPRFIQTIPKIGYRLIVPVSLETFAENDFEAAHFPTGRAAVTTAQTAASNYLFFFAGLATAVVLLAMFVVFAMSRHRPGGFH